MNIITIIQARMSSSRLPGKVMMRINEKPLLYYVYTRAARSKFSNKVIVATSKNSADDLIVKYCSAQQYHYFRGSLDDVLDRFYHTAKIYKGDIIIRLTSDCPLIDSNLIDMGLKVFMKGKYDYLSTKLTRTFPIGFDFEILSFSALETAWKKSTTMYEKEHVTPYIWQSHPNQFRSKSFEQKDNKSAYRVTVDTLEDFRLVKILIEKYKADKMTYQEITSLLNNQANLIKK